MPLNLQARMVAAATNNLCEAANSAVQGHASEEKLISSAKQVAASTAQLLVACKVKADQDSQTMKRLQVSTPCFKPLNLMDTDTLSVLKPCTLGNVAKIFSTNKNTFLTASPAEDVRNTLWDNVPHKMLNLSNV